MHHSFLFWDSLFSFLPSHLFTRVPGFFLVFVFLLLLVLLSTLSYLSKNVNTLFPTLVVTVYDVFLVYSVSELSSWTDTVNLWTHVTSFNELSSSST